MTSSKKSGPVGVTQHHVKSCPRVGSCKCPWGFYAKVRAPGGVRQFAKRGYATQKAAKEARAAIIEGHRVGTLATADRSLTTGEWLERWYRLRTVDSEKPIRSTTARGYRQVLDGYLIPRLGAVRLVDLRAEHIEHMMRGIRADRPDLAASSRKGIYSVLRSALGKAVQRKLLAVNPCTAVDRDALPSDERPEVQPWSPEELAAFLDHPTVQAHRLGAVYEVAAFTGLRRGELCGLRWVDVDLDAAVLTIRQAAVQVGHQVLIGKPKTRSGQRRLDLDAGTVAVLRAVRVRQAAERLGFGEAYVDSGLVFTDESGVGFHPERLTKGFVRLTKAAGLRQVRLHDLRHGSASLQLAAGVDLAIVSKRLGHSQISLTADTYSHLIGSVGRDAAEAAAALVPRKTRTAG